MAIMLRTRLLQFVIAASFSIVLFSFIAGLCSSGMCGGPTDRSREIRYGFFHSRKLLHQGTQEAEKEPSRIGEGCSPDNIIIIQGATTPLPNGIPTYTVEILNECISGDECSIGNIHLSCGWFSSARLVNPRLFHRVGYDDCLVNDGLPISNGQSISFQYANSFHYPLSVSSATCVSSSPSPSPSP